MKYINLNQGGLTTEIIEAVKKRLAVIRGHSGLGNTR